MLYCSRNKDCFVVFWLKKYGQKPHENWPHRGILWVTRLIATQKWNENHGGTCHYKLGNFCRKASIFPRFPLLLLFFLHLISKILPSLTGWNSNASEILTAISWALAKSEVLYDVGQMWKVAYAWPGHFTLSFVHVLSWIMTNLGGLAIWMRDVVRFHILIHDFRQPRDLSRLTNTLEKILVSFLKLTFGEHTGRKFLAPDHRNLKL